MVCMGAANMESDQEVWQAASRFVERYGDRAPAEAEVRQGEMDRLGDAEAVETWSRIVQATRDILKDQRDGARH